MRGREEGEEGREGEEGEGGGRGQEKREGGEKRKILRPLRARRSRREEGDEGAGGGRGLPPCPTPLDCDVKQQIPTHSSKNFTLTYTYCPNSAFYLKTMICLPHTLPN